MGIALETFSGGADGSPQGTVTVFLDLQRGIDIDQIGITLLGTSATSTPGTPFDFVGTLLSSIVSRITAPAASTSDATSTSATSTSATSTPSIADSFFGALFSRIAQWFADAANGIGDFFAKRIVGDQLCARKSDGSLECLTGDQLAALLASAGQSAAPTSTPSSAASSSLPTTPPTPESSASPVPSDAATPSINSGQASSPDIYTEPVERVTESIPPIIDLPPLAPEEEPEPTLTPPTSAHSPTPDPTQAQ